LRQDGREAYLRPGDLALYDAARPHRIDCPGAFEKLIVSIPRSLLRERLFDVEHCTALPVSAGRGIAAVTSDFIRDCARQSSALGLRDFSALAEHSLDLLTRTFAAVRPQRHAMARGRQTALATVKVHIEQNLHDSTLQAVSIAAIVGLSVRYINELFHAESMSLMRYVWERRLERCRQLLLAPAASGANISDIAYRCGFSDPAHFSRAFKQRFGCSPRAYRQQYAD
jgi:AraC family transcriptional regulator, positive regulator of tynA and feaB